MPAPLLVSVPEAKTMLAIGQTKFYDLVNKGKIETVKLGRKTCVRVSSLERLAETGA